MIRGLQTHFGYPRGNEEMKKIAELGVEFCRIATFDCTRETLDTMVREVEDFGMQPLITVPLGDVRRLSWVPHGRDAEWGNEPATKVVKPHDYRMELNDACVIASVNGFRLWAPAIMNLSPEDITWLNKVRDADATAHGWPTGLYGISAHTYGPYPHGDFGSRDNEVKWFKAACVDKPFMITEFGYETPTSEDESKQVEYYKTEWAFWERHRTYAVFAFQLEDDINAKLTWGIRRPDGSFKPAAYTFKTKQEAQGMSGVSMTQLFKLDQDSIIENQDGSISLKWNLEKDCTDPSSKEVLSLQPDGRIETRPIDKIDAWEKGRPEGGRLVFRNGRGRAVFAWQD